MSRLTPPVLFRPYALTGGRTVPAVDLPLETLVRTTDAGRRALRRVGVEQRRILQLCEQSVSVVEVAARIEVPLGVARVLVGDLVVEHMVELHHPATTQSARGAEYRALLEKVLDGIERL